MRQRYRLTHSHKRTHQSTYSLCIHRSRICLVTWTQATVLACANLRPAMKLAAATPGPSSRPRMGCFKIVATAASGLFVMSTVVSVGMKGAKSVIRRRQVCPPACHHGVTCSPAAHTLALQPQRHCHYGMFSEQPVVLQMAHATTCSTCSGRKTVGCDICRGAAPLRGLRVVSGG